MSKTIEPDGRFLERLEWQLASEFRRSARFHPSGARVSLSRRAAVGLLMVGLMMTGVAVMKAADLIKDSWRKKIEIARAETDVILKRAAYDLNREAASRTEHLFTLGLISKEDRWAGTRASTKAEDDWKKAAVNLDEVMATGEPPRDELYAPRAGGRDFVGERLTIALRDAEGEMTLVETGTKRMRELVSLGLVSKEDLDRREAEIAARREAVDEIGRRLALRKRFLEGTVAARDVEIEGRLAAAEARAKSLQAKVEALRENVSRLEVRVNVGVVSPMDVQRLRAELDAAQLELKLTALEKDLLRKAR